MAEATASWQVTAAGTLGEALDEVAAKYPDSVALVFKGQRITYSELQRQANLLAKGLLRLGVGRGDNVAIWLRNCPEWLVAEYAVAKVGAAIATVNTRNRVHETAYILNQSQSKVLILRDRFANIEFLAMLREMAPELATSKPGALRAARLPHLRSVICLGEEQPEGAFSFAGIQALGKDVPDAELARAQAACQPDDVLLIVYTSGTTGQPKGAMLTHRNTLPHLAVVAERMQMTQADKQLFGLPFFHIGGSVLVTMTALLSASTICLMEAFDATEALQTIDRERCTVIHGVPTMYIDILAHPDFSRYSTTSLRTGWCGGQGVPVDLLRAIMGRMGVRQIQHVYGLTEGSGNQTSSLPDDSPELIATSVGVPYRDQEVALFDPTTDERLGYDRQGELRVRATSVMKGYYKNPEETAKTIDKDGWLHTGDLAVQDANGHYRITGRLKDMYICGGTNAYPAEIENFLYTLPKVKNVYVVGVPDYRLGEVAMAFVELKEGEAAVAEEIVDFCKGKLANYKIPRYVKFMREFPLTPSGKVQKYVLQERAIAELGLAQSQVPLR